MTYLLKNETITGLLPLHPPCLFIKVCLWGQLDCGRRTTKCLFSSVGIRRVFPEEDRRSTKYRSHGDKNVGTSCNALPYPFWCPRPIQTDWAQRQHASFQKTQTAWTWNTIIYRNNYSLQSYLTLFTSPFSSAHRTDKTHIITNEQLYSLNLATIYTS